MALKNTKLARRLCYGLNLWRTAGFKELLHMIKGRVRSEKTLLLLERVWDPVKMTYKEMEPEITFRDGRREDIDEIARAWPPEFHGQAPTPEALRLELERKFNENIPCFVACNTQGHIIAGIWCISWEFDSALPPDLQGRPSYEVNALFTITEVRTNTFLPIRLINFAMERMVGEYGKTVAYIRSLSPRRHRLFSMYTKHGLRKIGFLTNGVRFGKPYCCLKEEEDKTSSRKGPRARSNHPLEKTGA
ncbi:hypothetical protein HQ520_13760 [bacterium]|nr:hypothetical protein [bacterium]